MNIKAVHVVPSISRESSGLSYSVVSLCRSLTEANVATTLVVLDDCTGHSNPGFVRSFPVSAFPARLGRSSGMRRWLNKSVTRGDIDILHNHSLWMMPNVYAGHAVKGTDVPLLVSPRGTMSQRAMSSGSSVKRLFWPLVQRPALQAVNCFHATAVSEYLDIRRMGFRQPVAIIPNGVGIPAGTKARRGEMRTLLYLGRIHPIKGLDNLLPAWKAVQQCFPEWQLRIVGPDNRGYMEEVRHLAAKLQLKRVEFVGPLTGDQKIQAYFDADLFVLPSYSENFGMTVAESLAAGTPAIVTKGAPWSGLDDRNSGRWIEIGIDPLVACLQQMLPMSRAELDAMGLNGRNWMIEEYSWADIAPRMRQTYEWIAGEGSKPDFVRS